MQNSGDNYIYDNSMEQQNNDFVFEKKEVIYSTDSNNGAYSNGVIQFDLASLSNCGRACDLKNSTLLIPTVLRVSGSALSADVQNAFAASWKNHIHTIDSISVQLSNHSVVEPCEYSNIPCNFKLLTEMSKQELEAYNYSFGFFKDNVHSLRVNTADTDLGANGYESNNDSNVAVTAVVDGVGFGSSNYISQFASNPAVMDRMLNTSFDITDGDRLANASNYTQCGKAVCVRTGANPNAAVTYYGLITLPLRFLNDFFNKMPLIRNSYLKMAITTNLVSRSVITVANGAATYTGYQHQLSAKCVPYMLSQINQGWKKLSTGTSLTIESGIGKISGWPENPIMTACRIYTPTYTLTANIEAKYFTQGPKQILYSSYYRAVTGTIANGSALNSFLVTNGLSRIRSILIMPVQTDATGVINNFTNPWSSSPSTTAPYAFMRNFNIRIGGSPHYAENVFYSWQMFQDEILARGINGNLELGLGSGLLNQLEWNAGYRFIYVDLSRKTGQGMDDVSKSIHLDGINASGYHTQYHIFVEYQKMIHVDLSTGQLVTV